jgi:hypothetical protein
MTREEWTRGEEGEKRRGGEERERRGRENREEHKMGSSW